MSADLDRIKGALASFVRGLFPQIDYLARYPARVVGQNADGTLELVPDDARLPGLSGVPIRIGIPGVTVKVTAGRVLLGFAGGDPSKPVAELWEGGAAVTEVKFSGGSEPLVLGSTYRTAEDALFDAIGAYATAIKGIADPTNAATPTLQTAIATFKAGSYLSTKVKTA